MRTLFLLWGHVAASIAESCLALLRFFRLPEL